MLDVGAGSGSVTAQLAGLFDQVVATEVSTPMVARLRARKGVTFVIEAEDLGTVQEKVRAEGIAQAGQEAAATERFTCICALNLLDRCDRPRELLREIWSMLAPGGVLLMAVVCPFRPFVEGKGTQKN